MIERCSQLHLPITSGIIYLSLHTFLSVHSLAPVNHDQLQYFLNVIMTRLISKGRAVCISSYGTENKDREPVAVL
jgi:hypothetical protein